MCLLYVLYASLLYAPLCMIFVCGTTNGPSWLRGGSIKYSVGWVILDTPLSGGADHFSTGMASWHSAPCCVFLYLDVCLQHLAVFRLKQNLLRDSRFIVSRMVGEILGSFCRDGQTVTHEVHRLMQFNA